MRWPRLASVVLFSLSTVALAQQEQPTAAPDPAPTATEQPATVSPATPASEQPAAAPAPAPAPAAATAPKPSEEKGLSTYPKPSPYPITWELDFTHGAPKRVVVNAPGGPPKAYWYMTYTVTNNTDEERTFLPVFEMLTDDGRVIRSDRNIPYRVFEVIKSREGNRFLEHFTQLGGQIRLGEDQAKEGVAIWEEPMPEMGHFSIFANNLSGEIVIMKDENGKDLKDPDGRPVILRKTKQLNYFIRGDDVFPGEDQVNENPEQWVMR